MNSTSQNPWDFFPLIMCINLKERSDRHQEAREELQRVGIDRLTFFRAERQKDRDKGCLDSHMACLKYAVDQGVSHAIIFEDDVQFQDGYVENMQRVVEFFKTRKDCNFLHLGGFIFRRAERCGEHFIRGGIMCTHAYVIRTEYAKKILAERNRYHGMSIDTFYTILNRNSAFVHVKPLVCIQRASESDGTWDSRNVGSSGWLGQAMIYTSLDFGERLRYAKFPMVERIRIQNGMSFFRVYRHVMKWKAAFARRRQGETLATTDFSSGEFVVDALSPSTVPQLAGKEA